MRKKNKKSTNNNQQIFVETNMTSKFNRILNYKNIGVAKLDSSH